MNYPREDRWSILRTAAESASERRAFEEAEALWLAALELAESDEEGSARLTASLEGLTEAFWLQRKYSLAAPILRRLLRIYKKHSGAGHFHYGIIANNMAMLYHSWGKLAEAEPFYIEAFRIKRVSLGESHPDTISILRNYSRLLHALDRGEEARKLESRVDILKESVVSKETSPTGFVGHNFVMGGAG